MDSHDKTVDVNKIAASTILFVDDEKQTLKYFEKSLQKQFAIKTANSVDKAIEVLEQQHQEIAIVISDQKMPVKQGLELLRYTKENHPEIIRMLTTAYFDTENTIEAINKAEVFRFIPKPWNVEELHKNLNQALNRFQSSNQNQQVSPNEYMTLQNFKEDCEQWLSYALHAYGDVDIYKGGIEAHAYNYHVLIHKEFAIEQVRRLSASMNKMLEEYFLNEEIILNMHAQRDIGFGLPNLLSKNKH